MNQQFEAGKVAFERAAGKVNPADMERLINLFKTDKGIPEITLGQVEVIRACACEGVYQALKSIGVRTTSPGVLGLYEAVEDAINKALIEPD
jgi:hypothetical protein